MNLGANTEVHTGVNIRVKTGVHMHVIADSNRISGDPAGDRQPSNEKRTFATYVSISAGYVAGMFVIDSAKFSLTIDKSFRFRR